GLPSNTIKAIQEDDHGNLWISTSNGISKFSPRTGTFINFNKADGMQIREFKSASIKTQDGKIYFGSTNGFSVFHQDSIKQNTTVPPVYLNNLQIFNNDVVVGEEGSPLQKDISETEAITLSYKQSVFSFEFVALSYASPEQNQ